MRSQIGLIRLPLSLAVGAGTFAGMLMIAQAWFLAHVVNAVTIEGQNLAGVWRWLVPLLGIILARVLISGFVDSAAFAAAARVKQGLRSALYAHVSALGPAWMLDQRSGEVANTLVDGVEEIEKYYANYLPQSVLAALLPFAILVAAFPADWVSGLIFLVTAPLIPIFMIIIGKGAEALNQRQWRRLSRMSAHFFDVIEGLTTLKLFNASRREAEVVARISDEYRGSTMSVLRVAFLSSLVLEFFATVSIALAAVYIGFRLYYRELDFFSGFFVLLLAPEFYRPLRDMGAQYHARMAAIASAESILRLLQTPLPDRHANRMPLPPEQRLRIDFEGVSFSYDRDGQGVQDISFTLSQAECVALVGPSGAGKSTIGNLLLGFLAPQSGSIRINGVDLQDLDEAEWLRRVSWVPQKPTLFYGTVGDNIRLGAPEASEQAVHAAAAQAQADGFIARLVLDYETMLGDSGQGLSGGEIRRIALARAFLKDADVVILDEATGALDRPTATRVMDAVRQVASRSAVLFITHDLEAARMADRVITIERGRIVARANPREPGLRKDLHAGPATFEEVGL
ncbi:thiol reductant ABC exporter subunit CydD [Rhizobiaceae bacterium n13]|uniref:Thiol reductant ABC exporter subunit CydD n=1 Tax=Ferirhizobium litorale TaxID=2927786 RepID=A0AAE3QJR6_9HYPH|nr:thiol reductant ABC exporter subunit CydD [Fererhizobium litorale]MDI7862743.1 thiol reductant ABC exporter subunit CydD [Fererhizobium litorale]MDI7924393.1 thiol reductant ABC exporter subunit CydD [Fererhizobium litorale]